MNILISTVCSAAKAAVTRLNSSGCLVDRLVLRAYQPKKKNVVTIITTLEVVLYQKYISISTSRHS